MPYFNMMGDILAKTVQPAIFVISTIFKGIGKTIGAFIDALKPGFDSMMKALQPIRDVFAKIFSPKGDTGKIMDMIMRVFSIVGNIVGTVIGTAFKAIGNVITHIANVFGYVIDFFKGDIGFGEMVGGILGSMIDMVGNIVTTLWEGIKSVFSSLGTYIYDQIKDSISFLGSWFGGDDTEETKVNDAVISPQGEIISTSPEDYLIATKNPSALADATSGAMGAGGTTMDMSSVIGELKSLKEAFLSNRDVYIDNQKVTSRITKTQEKSNINQFGLMGA